MPFSRYRHEWVLKDRCNSFLSDKLNREKLNSYFLWKPHPSKALQNFESVSKRNRVERTQILKYRKYKPKNALFYLYPLNETSSTVQTETRQ